MTSGQRLPAGFCLAFCALFVSVAARAQSRESDIPEGLKDKALTITINAVVMGQADTVAWQAGSSRSTIPGTPVGVKLVGTNVAILVQLTPFDDGKGGLVLVTQGQVWVKRPNGELSYFTSLDTVAVHYGERVYFFPLGRSTSGEAAMRVEVSVEHYALAPPSAKSASGSAAPLGPVQSTGSQVTAGSPLPAATGPARLLPQANPATLGPSAPGPALAAPWGSQAAGSPAATGSPPGPETPHK